MYNILMRNVPFVKNEYYHIFNRGVDKREIFSDKHDAVRFIQSMQVFNNTSPGNDIFLVNRVKSKKVGHPVANKIEENHKKLVNIICYCLNSNHYHFILEQLVDGGISEFMKRLSSGYANYYNKKFKRSGALFQGKFKSVHIGLNEQLLHVSAYVNLNNKVHKKFDGNKKHFLDLIPSRSSWDEYINKHNGPKICEKDIVLGQFKNIKDYKIFAEEVIGGIKEKRYEN